jgi:hypothetical protein
MDVLSLLAAVVAVALFPGGAYAAVTAAAAAMGGQLPSSGGRARGVAAGGWTASSSAAAVLLLFAAALVPLPGAPAATLPLDSGAPSNLLAALLLAGAGFAVGTPAPWSRPRVLAAAAGVAPLLVLAGSAATLSFPVVVSLPGRELAAARALAAVALLAAAPVLSRALDPGTPRGTRGLGVAVPALVAAVLLAPPGWADVRAPVAAAMVVAGVGLYGVLLGVGGRLLGTRAASFGAVAASVAAIAAITLSALASH